MKMNKWHNIYMNMCDVAAEPSKDSSVKVGCIFTNDENRIVVTGYNGIPRKLEDTPERLERPAKYDWTVHAEMNCIDYAAKEGVALKGSTVYSNYYPCSECASHLVNVEIKRLVTYTKPDSPEYKNYGFDLSEAKFREAGIEIVEYTKEEIKG